MMAPLHYYLGQSETISHKRKEWNCWVMRNLCVQSFEDCHTVFKLARSFHIPVCVYEDSILSTSSPTLILLSDSSHLHGYEVVCISLWFWFGFPWWLMMLYIFSCVNWPFTVHFSEMPINNSSFAHFKVRLSYYWVVSVLYIF